MEALSHTDATTYRVMFGVCLNRTCPAVDAHGMPVRAIITDGAIADCTQALPLIKETEADY